MATQTLVSNQSINSTVTSPALNVNGAKANATVTFSIHVPFGKSIAFITESSADGGATWEGKDSYSIDNTSGTKTQDFTRVAVLPEEIGLKIRARVTQIVGPITITSITLEN